MKKLSIVTTSFAVFFISFQYFFWATGNTSLWDIDEPIYAQSLKEMIAHHNLLVPTFNGHILPDKPILNYWLMWCGTKVFGWNSLGLRVGSAFVGALLILLLWVSIQRLYNRRVALLAAAMTVTLLHSTVIFRSATPDPLLILTVAAALIFFLIGYTEREKQGSRFLLFSYAAMALATLAKGPIGFLLPGLIIVLFLLTQGNLRFLWREGRLYIGVPLFLIIALPWYLAVGLETHWSWDRVFLLQQNIGRFDSSMQGHRGPWFYYALSIFLGMLPWSIFLPQALTLAIREQRVPQGEGHAKNCFMLIWGVVWAVFFSLSATKLPNYVWESYPPLVVLLAVYFDRYLHEQETHPPYLYWASGLVLFAIGLALSVYGGWILPRQEPELPRLALVGLPYAAAAVVATFLFWKRWLRAALISLGVGAVSLSALLVLVYTPEFNSLKPSRAMGQKIREIQQGAPYGLAAWQWFQPNFLFYAGRGAMPIQRLKFLDELPALAQHRPLYLVCPESRVQAVLAAVKPPLRASVLLVRFELYDQQKIALLRIQKTE
ncbi:glycosyltransferase family 39 protein [Acidithiobacillus sp.]|uniref:ArnT family glycosyltransferase n=1 Tax=Acidithiobacillus sp. TaxID=1872118 RepID=UPI0025C074F3|nr:glycosyltransferase family 39 protein [Acidithiobacillus sp.]